MCKIKWSCQSTQLTVTDKKENSRNTKQQEILFRDPVQMHKGQETKFSVY